MIQTVDFVASYVNSKHGWAVAEQFTDSFNGEAFGEQNYNALLYIRDTVRSILKSNVLSDDSYDELSEYMDELEDYIVGSSVDEAE